MENGRIREITDEGISVQAVGGRVLVKRVRPAGEAKMPANEWATAVGLKPGDSLGN